MSWLRRLVCRLLTVGPEFDPGSVQMTFFFDKVTLGQVFLQLLQLSPVLIIPPVVHIHSSLTLLYPSKLLTYSMEQSPS